MYSYYSYISVYYFIAYFWDYMIEFITALDIIGAIAGIIGAVRVMYIKKDGYIAFMICNVAYTTLGLLQGFYGLVLVSTIMFIIDVIAYRKWSKNEIN